MSVIVVVSLRFKNNSIHLTRNCSFWMELKNFVFTLKKGGRYFNEILTTIYSIDLINQKKLVIIRMITNMNENDLQDYFLFLS